MRIHLLEDDPTSSTDSETRMLQDIYDLAEKSLQEAKSLSAQKLEILAARGYKDSENRMKTAHAYAIAEMEKGEYNGRIY